MTNSYLSNLIEWPPTRERSYSWAATPALLRRIHRWPELQPSYATLSKEANMPLPTNMETTAAVAEIV